MAKAEAGVTILGSDWPGRELPAHPGDLTRAVPQGLGINVPIMITPYGFGPDLGSYGLDQPSSDPLRGAPTQEACGGLLYFDDGADIGMLRNALVVIGVHMPRKDYAVFAAEAKEPVTERYLDQGQRHVRFRIRSSRLASMSSASSPSRRRSGARSAASSAARLAATAIGPRSRSLSAFSSRTPIGPSTGCGAVPGWSRSDQSPSDFSPSDQFPSERAAGHLHRRADRERQIGRRACPC